MIGAAANDVLRGTSGRGVIVELGGDDQVDGRLGEPIRDQLDSGAGTPDRCDGHGGTDTATACEIIASVP